MKLPHNVLEILDEEFSEAKSLVLIGAMDGIFVEELYPYITKYGNNLETVVLVEPIPWWFEKLKKNYKEFPHFKFENSAIASETGKVEMVAVKPDSKLPMWVFGCSMIGTKFTNLLGWMSDEELESYKCYVEVPTLTLNDLLDRHNVSEVDILKIDAEGQDWNILKQIDFSKTQPRIIIFEIMHLSWADKSSALKYCTDNDYDILFNHDVVFLYRKRDYENKSVHSNIQESS